MCVTSVFIYLSFTLRISIYINLKFYIYVNKQKHGFLKNERYYTLNSMFVFNLVRLLKYPKQ